MLAPGPMQDAVACDHTPLCFAGALDLGQLALGEHTLRIVVTDIAGNVSELPQPTRVDAPHRLIGGGLS